MYGLLKNDTPYVWDEKCESAFTTLKLRLTSKPILQLPDMSKEFLLYTDASGSAVGAILAQRSPYGGGLSTHKT